MTEAQIKEDVIKSCVDRLFTKVCLPPVSPASPVLIPLPSGGTSARWRTRLPSPVLTGDGGMQLDANGDGTVDLGEMQRGMSIVFPTWSRIHPNSCA